MDSEGYKQAWVRPSTLDTLNQRIHDGVPIEQLAERAADRSDGDGAHRIVEALGRTEEVVAVNERGCDAGAVVDVPGDVQASIWRHVDDGAYQ